MVFLTEIRHNLRLRLGVWLILGIILSYILMLLQEKQASLLTEYQASESRLQQVQQIRNQPEWSQYLQVMRSELLLVESKLWQANTEGLAQANLQSWLETQAKKLQIQSSTVRVDPVIKHADLPVWQIKVQLEGNFEQMKLYDLLILIEESEYWLIIEKLEISQRSNIPYFQLFLSGFFQPEGLSK